MLNEKIKLKIDLDNDKIHVSCVPVSTNATLNTDDNKKEFGVDLDLNSTKPLVSLGFLPLDNIINKISSGILDELLKGLVDEHFLTCLDEYLSPEDPIYEHIMSRLYDNRNEIYHCYFDNDSLRDLYNQISDYLSKN